MSENQVEGGAGPALAAHSKDASATGHTRASRATADATSPREVDGANTLGGQAREAAGRVASTVSDAAGRVRDTVSGQTRQVVDQAGEFVRAQPLLTVAGFGLVCLLVGVLIGRQNSGR
jgi:ElaB/YqjD/DUF883 family membrane-anchored ribosome-binding protein